MLGICMTTNLVMIEIGARHRPDWPKMLISGAISRLPGSLAGGGLTCDFPETTREDIC